MHVNIVETFGKLARDGHELFLTNDGWLQYAALLEEQQQEQIGDVEKDGRVYRLINFKGA